MKTTHLIVPCFNNVAQQHPEIIAELDMLMRKSHVDSEAFPSSLPVQLSK